jgi:hypothetical protein
VFPSDVRHVEVSKETSSEYASIPFLARIPENVEEAAVVASLVLLRHAGDHGAFDHSEIDRGGGEAKVGGDIIVGEMLIRLRSTEAHRT